MPAYSKSIGTQKSLNILMLDFKSNKKEQSPPTDFKVFNIIQNTQKQLTFYFHISYV